MTSRVILSVVALLAYASPAAASAAPQDLAASYAAPWPGLQEPDGRYHDFMSDSADGAGRYGEAMLGYSLIATGLRRGDGRLLTSPQRIRCDRGLRAVVLAPIEEDLASPQALGHRRGDQLGHRLFQLLGNAFGQHHRTLAAHLAGPGRGDCRALLQLLRRRPA